MKIEEHISLQGHKGQVWSVAWNPKPCNHARHMLASSGDDAKTIVWHNIDSKWEEFQVLADEEKRSMRSCAWHPEGTTLAAGGCGTKISLWRYDQGTKEFSLLGNIHHFYGEKVKNLSWNMDGSLLLYCSNRGHISIAKESNNDGYVNVCRVKLEENVPLSCARWYPSGDKFVVAGSRDIKTFELDKNDQGVLEACASHANYTIIHTYHEGAINDVSFLSDQRMVSAGADKKLNFWWLDSSKFVLGSDLSKQKRYSWSFSTSSNEHKREILCTDWSRCAGAFGYLVASACEERTILLHMAGDKWNVSNPKTCTLAASKYDAHKGSIKDLKWHCEDPNKLASVGSDGLVKIWEVSQYTTQE